MNVVWLGLARTGDGLLESALNSESQSVALERDQLDLAFGLKRGEIEIAVVELVETMRDRNPPMAGDAHLDLELVTLAERRFLIVGKDVPAISTTGPNSSLSGCSRSTKRETGLYPAMKAKPNGTPLRRTSTD